MKKLLILLLVLSSCVVNRYTCDHKCVVTPTTTFTPGAVTNLPFLETTKPFSQTTKVNKRYILSDSTKTKHILSGYNRMEVIEGGYFTLTKNILMRPSSGTVVWSPLATDTTLTKNKLIIKQ